MTASSIYHVSSPNASPEVDQQLIDHDHAPLPADAVPPTPGFGPGSRRGARGVRSESEVIEGDLLDLDGSDPSGPRGGYFGSSAGLGGSLNGAMSDGMKGKKREEVEMLLAHRTVFFFKLEREIEKV